MRTLVHLSDLHFGRINEALLAPLRACVERLAPHVVVVSGDLTQRARSHQFQQARTWLDTLPKPQIIVPGNHDIPMFNVAARFLAPLRKYKRYVTADLAPVYIDDEIAVLGLNTARSLTIKDGRINREQVAWLRQRFGALQDGVVRIVVTHHPFDLPAHANPDDLVDRAPMAMQAFAECGVDVLLAGHVHSSHAGSSDDRYPITGYAALAVQAGTATSTRTRGEDNAFNVLRIEPDHVHVARYQWNGEEFVADSADTFCRVGDAWKAEHCRHSQ
ncbi:metallophosphoesterase [Pseudoduganella ginsengisoli]|uniref:Metallophosphoesterase n=1 Tax=Pseudoduganella ginsengisoli TaxID=1462440 RepID=A0A6L6Q978_9BURK|nr:metallophosphoesterase [Pseudoduganella ginsengisoli]MTW06014.1 metallophosphoesterase [Pseudoduganella ginsengisoli]